MTKDCIISESELSNLNDVDCILVLNSGVWDDGAPTDMLADRIKVGINSHFDDTKKYAKFSGVWSALG